MNNSVSIEKLASLLLNDIPFIDVRSPTEFSKGAVPSASNFPILNDSERTKVGTCYKQHGREAAIGLGNQLISGKRRENLLGDWKAFIRTNPESVIYCARGGLRSKISQQWLKEEGIERPIIAGGFKTLRNHLLSILDSVDHKKMIMLSGMTGIGKTEVIRQINPHIDLEGLANHRGSSFGKKLDAQPSQIDFENQLAIEWLRFINSGETKRVLIEDESRLIGKCFMPLSWQDAMRKCDIVLLEEEFDSRIERIKRQYVIDRYSRLLETLEREQAEQELESFLLKGLSNIRKRLGNEAYGDIQKLISNAVGQQGLDNFLRHEDWIKEILQRYYDPMYEYQLSKKCDRIVFRGLRSQVFCVIEEIAIRNIE